MSPAKKPPTDEEKNWTVRQEGKRGFLRIDKDFKDSIGEKKLEELFDSIHLQVFGFHNSNHGTEYYCYCPLFAPLKMSEKPPVYTMRVDLSEQYPVIEMIKRKEEF